MRINRIAISILFCLASGLLPVQSAKAGANQCDVNGCGPGGWLGSTIPDSTYFTKCLFKAACDVHDKCYSRCMECGDLHNTPGCNEGLKCLFNKYKIKCDDDLYTGIITLNPGKQICRRFAFAYSSAVKVMGCLYYYGRKLLDDQDDIFRKNFEELVRYHKYMTAHGLEIDKEEIDKVIELMLATSTNDQNVFEFSVQNGKPVLAIKSTRPPGDVKGFSGGEKGEGRTYLNGIDITHMRQGDHAFDAEAALKNAKQLNQGDFHLLKKGDAPGK